MEKRKYYKELRKAGIISRGVSEQEFENGELTQEEIEILLMAKQTNHLYAIKVAAEVIALIALIGIFV